MYRISSVFFILVNLFAEFAEQYKIVWTDIDPHGLDFWLLLVSIAVFILYIIFITYYLSRVFGFFATLLLNGLVRRFYGFDGRFYIGSINISILSGTLMVKDLVYFCDDYTLRIRDGYLIFSYWTKFYKRNIK